MQGEFLNTWAISTVCALKTVFGFVFMSKIYFLHSKMSKSQNVPISITTQILLKFYQVHILTPSGR